MSAPPRADRQRGNADPFPRPLDDRLAGAPLGACDAAPSPADASEPAPAGDTIVDARSIYEAYRRQIEHEDNLLANRSSWLLLAQSFLVVAYSILHQLAPPDPRVQPVTALLTQLLALLGVLTAVPILMSIVAASAAMRSLRAQFSALVRRRADLQRLLTVYPAIQIEGPVLVCGRTPAIALPLAFIIFWALVTLATALS